MKYSETIGIVGGMGSYATLDFFRRLLDAFPAEKEWDRPRVIIDNRCTMPSRVRAILYEEERPVIIEELTKAAQGLLNCGADYLIFACNTSHVFIPEVLRNIPEAEKKVIHIIDTLAKQMYEDGVRQAYLLASEGTIESRIYQQYFERYGISITSPKTEEYAKLREYIEIVKQNQVNDSTKRDFLEFVSTIPYDNIILGCTEFPVLLSTDHNGINGLYDPLNATIEHLKKTIK